LGVSSTFSASGTYYAIGASLEEKVYVYQVHTPNPPTGVPGYTLLDTLISPLGLDGFGSSVAFSADGNVLVVGLPKYLNSKGAFSVFKKVGSNWVPVNTIISPDGVGISISNTYGDNFGKSVDVNSDGSVIAIGSPWHTVDVNLYGKEAGSVYIYNFDLVSNITLEQVVYPTDGEQQDNFGWDVSLSDDGLTLLASSYDDEDKGNAAGSAYLFEKSTSWLQTNKFLASDGAAEDRFGQSVALAKNANVVAIGSYKDTNAQGTFAGAVYVYRKVGPNWIETKIVEGDLVSNSSFGFDVALDACGLTLSVGQLSYNFEYELTTGSNYTYEYDGANWILLQKFTDNYQNEDLYGFTSTLSRNGNYLAVGAPNYETQNGMSHVYQLRCFGRTVSCPQL
jgi:hypothetical protein